MFLMTIRASSVPDYEVHQHLHHYFPPHEGREFLWRWGEDRRAWHVLSRVPPVQTVPYRTIGAADIPSGRPVEFSLRFVLARCKRREGKRGSRVPSRDMRERRAWLMGSLSEMGARVLFAHLQDAVVIGKWGQPVAAADVTGTLVVDDRARFCARLQTGIGRNRAFGCGLIWLHEVFE